MKPDTPDEVRALTAPDGSPELAAAPPPRTRRRYDTGWVGSPQHFAWLELIVRAILILNLADAVLTIFWISSFQAVEANPLLATLAHDHPLAFVAVKLSLVSLGTLLLWRHRKRPSAVVSIFAAFLAYYFLLVYHLEALNPRLLDRVTGWLR